MQVKCEYCDNYYDDSLGNCTNCNATNKYKRIVDKDVPTTIEELKKWVFDNKLKEKGIDGVIIGSNSFGASVIGIYFDEKNNNFVVYKNQQSGERNIRYEGKDGKYAVNEVYLKLKNELKNANMALDDLEQEKRNKKIKRIKSRPILIELFTMIIIAFCIIMFIGILLLLGII